MRMLAVLMALIFGSVAPASAMTFRLLHTPDGQRMVAATGEIVPGDARRLARALSQATRDRHGTKNLLLDSPGGLVSEAFGMADVMDRTGVSTIVPAGAFCGSACASVLFVSGRYRTVERGGALVIHSCYDALSGQAMGVCDALISAHAQYEGVSGKTLMALQALAGTNAAFVFGNQGAACFGLTRAPGSRGPAAAPCLTPRKPSARR